MNPAHHSILSDLRRIIRAVNLEGKRVEREYGVSIPQYLCLSYLHDRPDYIASMTEIKESLQLNPSTTTGIVQRLERNGFVAKLPKSQDRRKSLVILTEKGASIVRENPQILHDQLVDRLNGLSERDFEDLKQAFGTIIGFLEIGRVDAAPIVTAEVDFQPPAEED